MRILAVLLVVIHLAVMFTQLSKAVFVDSETGKQWREEWIADSPFRDHNPKDIPQLLWRLASVDYGAVKALGATASTIIRVLATLMLAALLLSVGMQIRDWKPG